MKKIEKFGDIIECEEVCTTWKSGLVVTSSETGLIYVTLYDPFSKYVKLLNWRNSGLSVTMLRDNYELYSYIDTKKYLVIGYVGDIPTK